MKVDLAVVGGGSGGYIAARRAAQLGMTVAVVEGRHLGGVCLNRGCVPTKTMAQAVRIVDRIGQGASYGVRVSAKPEIDYGALLAKRNEAVARLRDGLAELLRLAGIPVIAGQASLSSPTTLAIRPSAGGVLGVSAGSGPAVDTIEAHNILIATGSRSADRPMGCPQHARVIDSDGALALDAVPSRIVVIGAGPIGCEWSYIFAGLGCHVTLVTRRPHVLPHEDPEIGEALGEALAARGVTVHTRTTVESIVGSPSGVKVELKGEGGASIRSEYVLLATGRAPLTEQLGLDSVGVKTSTEGWIEVDDYLRTNVPSILAIGDVTGRCLMAHAAFRHAVVAVEKLAGLAPAPAWTELIPNVVYTEPEVATVGLTEERARDRGISVRVGSFPGFANARAVTRGQEEGFVKVVAESGGGKILGVQMIGPEAGELIGDAVSALLQGLSVSDLGAVVRPHPSLSESLGEACLTAAGRPLFSV